MTLSTEPRPAFTSASVTRKSGSSWICSSFSCSVICPSRLFTRVSIAGSAGCRAGASAASSLDCVAAITPPAAAPLTAITAAAIAARCLNLDMCLPFRALTLAPGAVPAHVTNDTCCDAGTGVS